MILIIFKKKKFSLIEKKVEFTPPEFKKIKNSVTKFFSIFKFGKLISNFLIFLNKSCAMAVLETQGFLGLNKFFFY